MRPQIEFLPGVVPLTEEILRYIKTQNEQNDIILTTLEDDADAITQFSPFTIASMGVDFVNVLLAEIGRLRVAAETRR